MPPPSLDKSTVLRAIAQLLDGKEPKQVAYNFNCSIAVIYDIRDKYMVQKWVLKRHPKDTFKLES